MRRYAVIYVDDTLYADTIAALAASGLITLDGSVDITDSANGLVIGETYGRLFFNTGATHPNWKIGAQDTVSEALSFYYANANSATPRSDTYVEVLRLNNSGQLKLIGSAFLGDGGTTNYAEVKSDGEINLHGTARVWVPDNLDPESVKRGPTPPASDQKGGFSFDRYDPVTEESVLYLWTVPETFATGTASVKGYYTFLVENPNGPGGSDLACVLGFEYKKFTPNTDVFDFSSGTSSGSITTTITAGQSADLLQQTAIGTCTTTGWAVGDIIGFRFYRDTSDPADTYYDVGTPPTSNYDVWVSTYHLLYLTDKLGEAS